MAVSRFANAKPLAGINTLLWEADRQALVSVVAVNIGGTTKISAYVDPSDEPPTENIYYIDDVPLKNRDTFETFKLAVNVGDRVYVSSESGDVSFFTNGIYDKNGTTDIHVGTQSPEYPVVGTIWIDESDSEQKRVKYFDGSSFVDVGIIGDTGPSNTLTVGTITTGETGSDADVEITGTSPNQTINFTLPAGPLGPANTLTVGSVTSVGPDEDPEVTITGDAPNQTISFALQQGIQGPAGDLGTATLDDLQDVTVTGSPTEGSLLVYDETTEQWENREIVISDLQDVTITGTPTQGSLLVYNETLQQWENKESSENIPNLNMVIMGVY
jgi:hypothetical protein